MENNVVSTGDFPFTQIVDGLYKSWFKETSDEEVVKKNASFSHEWRTYNVAEDGVAACALVPNVNIYSYAKNVDISSACGLSRVFTYGNLARIAVSGKSSIVCASGCGTTVNICGDHNFSLIGGAFCDISVYGHRNITDIAGNEVSVGDFGVSNSVTLYGTDILASAFGNGGEIKAVGSGARISVLGPHYIIDVVEDRSVLSIHSDNCAFRVFCSDTVVFIAEYGYRESESQESVVHAEVFSVERGNIKTATWYMYEWGALHELQEPPECRDYGCV